MRAKTSRCFAFCAALFACFLPGTMSPGYALPSASNDLCTRNVHLPAWSRERLPQKTLLQPGPAYAFAAQVPNIERELRARRYDRAAHLFSTWYGYRDGMSEPLDASVAGFFAGDAADSFIATYQSFSCGSAQLDLHNDPETAAILSRALVDAARGHYVEAREAALETYRRDPAIGEGLLLAGQIDLLLGDRHAARNVWLRALTVRAPVYPEEIGPDYNIMLTIEYLLHYRP